MKINEKAILARILLEPSTLCSHFLELLPEDFAEERNRLIYSAMIEIYGQQNYIDIVTLNDFLETSGGLERIGGTRYLSSLLDYTERDGLQ